MSGLDDWLSVARGADADELRERILTGFKAGKPFTPYIPTVDLPPVLILFWTLAVVSAGTFLTCRRRARRVYGFDLPPMIERCRDIAPVTVNGLWDDWSRRDTERFDLIFASLVLQHIEPQACLSYLADFARLSPLTYLLTRTTTDFGTNVLDHCIAADAFDDGRLHDRRARRRDQSAQDTRRAAIRGTAAVRGRGSLRAAAAGPLTRLLQRAGAARRGH